MEVVGGSHSTRENQAKAAKWLSNIEHCIAEKNISILPFSFYTKHSV